MTVPELLRRFIPRPALAAVLALLATGLPAAAWLEAGLADLSRRIELVQHESRLVQNDRAAKLASQLADRLEVLRSVEALRPHYHYTNPYHDSESGELVVSPLAEGPGDPAVLGYFLVNPQGGVALPSLGTTPTNAPSGAELEVRLALRTRLADLASQLLAPFAHVTKTPQSPGHPVLIGPLRWRQVEEGDQPLLVASRYLATMDGTWAQGFVLDAKAVETAVSSRLHPVRVVAGRPSHVGQAKLQLAGVTWRVVLDLSNVNEAARAEAEFLRRDFTRTYRLGVLLALLAGLSLVLLVIQTDRLAQQRATFAAIAAHELRTPLAGLRLQAELLSEGLGDPRRTKDKARKIAAEAERLGRVVHNVLSYSTLDRGQLTFNLQRGDLTSVVRETLERLRTGVETAGAVLDCRIDAGLPAIDFDEDAVSSLLINLVDNAVKYSAGAEDRRILVTVERAQRPNGPDWVELSVADHGPGLPRGRLGNSFGFFRRGTRPSSVVGLGLGLALSAKLAEGQGGTLVAENCPGARVVLRLPVPPPEEHTARSAAAAGVRVP